MSIHRIEDTVRSLVLTQFDIQSLWFLWVQFIKFTSHFVWLWSSYDRLHLDKLTKQIQWHLYTFGLSYSMADIPWLTFGGNFLCIRRAYMALLTKVISNDDPEKKKREVLWSWSHRKIYHYAAHWQCIHSPVPVHRNIGCQMTVTKKDKLSLTICYSTTNAPFYQNDWCLFDMNHYNKTYILLFVSNDKS